MASRADIETRRGLLEEAASAWGSNRPALVQEKERDRSIWLEALLACSRVRAPAFFNSKGR